MSELKKLDVYACALAMPTPDNPICSEWVEEISRHVEWSQNDDVYLVGHSLGSPAILRYLELAPSGHKVDGAVLVSGHSEKNDNEKLNNFLETPFDLEKIKSKVEKLVIIHSDNDPFVSLHNAVTLSKGLEAKLLVIPNGGHFTGRGGWRTFPQCLEVLKEMMG